MQPYEYWKKSPTLDLVFTTFLWSLPKFPYVSIEWATWSWDHMTSWASHDALVMVVPMEQWAGQPFQDKSADLWVVMLSDHNEKYSDRMERSYEAFAVTFELRFPFPLMMKSQHYIASGIGLVPSGNKPLPKPMLTKFYVSIWHHVTRLKMS